MFNLNGFATEMNTINQNSELKWIELLSKYNIIKTQSLKYFSEISDKYSNENRQYHNLEHISEMIDFIESCKDKIHNIDNVLFAVWFHDYVYNPHKTNNEELSAEAAKKFLKEINYNRDNYKTVYKMILRTANHSEFKDKDTSDLQIFLDSDIFILASDENKYSDYAAKIRKEYSYICETRYNQGRIKVLEKFMKCSKIFHFPEHQVKYDNIARQNIKNEIKFLAQKL